jgi:hypothetical protein
VGQAQGLSDRGLLTASQELQARIGSLETEVKTTIGYLDPFIREITHQRAILAQLGRAEP